MAQLSQPPGFRALDHLMRVRYRSLPYAPLCCREGQRASSRRDEERQSASGAAQIESGCPKRDRSAALHVGGGSAEHERPRASWRSAVSLLRPEISHEGGLGRTCDQSARFLTSHARATWRAASVHSPTSGWPQRCVPARRAPGTAKPFNEVRAEAAKVESAIHLGEAFGIADGHFDARRVQKGAARAEERCGKASRRDARAPPSHVAMSCGNVMEKRPAGLLRPVRDE